MQFMSQGSGLWSVLLIPSFTCERVSKNHSHTHHTAHPGYFSEEQAKTSIRTISRRTSCMTRLTRTRGGLFPTALDWNNEFRDVIVENCWFYGSENVCGRYTQSSGSEKVGWCLEP